MLLLFTLTQGTCSNLKSAFESHISEKRRALQHQNSTDSVPTASQPRQSAAVSKSRSANLPNMFQQVERREAEFAKAKAIGAKRENIPIDKKIFNNFLDKFEDENSRK